MEGYVQIILQYQFAQNHNITTKTLQKVKSTAQLRIYAGTRQSGL